MSKVTHDENTVRFVCLGCGQRHAFNVCANHQEPVYRWNENSQSPTIYGTLQLDTDEYQCHLAIRAGVLQFLSYCTHRLAGHSEKMRDE